jgi:hypothetical protein
VAVIQGARLAKDHDGTSVWGPFDAGSRGIVAAKNAIKDCFYQFHLP